MFSKGNAAHPVGFESPLKIIIKTLNFMGHVCLPTANYILAVFDVLKNKNKKARQMAITICKWTVTPDQITQQNSL
jgi:hypothetical protein